MIIHYEDQHFDLEEQGRCNLVLIAVRYTGDRSSISVDRFRNEAAWPGHSPLQARDNGDSPEPGPPQGALIPDWTDDETDNRTVESLESFPDVEVFYRPGAIAEAMLETNYLDGNVFGMGFDEAARERVFDTLGLKEAGVRDMAEYRRQLREVAGIDPDADEVQAETRDSGRVSEYRRDNTRQELIEAARILDYEGDTGVDPAGRGKIELSTWLADQGRKAVRFAFEDKVEAARDAAGLREDSAGPVEDDFEAGDAVDVYEYDELREVVKDVREGAGEFDLRSSDVEEMATFLVETKGLGEAEIDAHLME